MPTPAPPHAIPPGPLAVRWLSYEIPLVRAGTRVTGQVKLRNAGSATWRSRGTEGVQLAYHWLDPLGNPIVWDGVRSALPHAVGPGETVELPVDLRGPIPPGEYRLAFDLVHEHRFWFGEVGNEPLALPVEVLPRLARRALAVRIGPGTEDLITATRAALANQEETVAEEAEATAHLAAGCRPEPDWSRRILDAHEEGFVAVGGSILVEAGRLERRRFAELRPWAPGFGRAPEWSRELLCPSLLVAAPLGELAGLPAVRPADLDGPYLCDGRVRVAVPARALRQARRRNA